MELFQAKDEYILQSGDSALWCSRRDGSMTVRPGTCQSCRPLICRSLRYYITTLQQDNITTLQHEKQTMCSIQCQITVFRTSSLIVSHTSLVMYVIVIVGHVKVTALIGHNLPGEVHSEMIGFIMNR